MLEMFPRSCNAEQVIKVLLRHTKERPNYDPWFSDIMCKYAEYLGHSFLWRFSALVQDI